MKLETVRKVVTLGFTLSVVACFVGIFVGGQGNAQVYQYAMVAAALLLLFTLAVVMKWARCPWCGGSLLRKFFTLKVCPHCHRDLITGKRKKDTEAEAGNKWRVRLRRVPNQITMASRRRT